MFRISGLVAVLGAQGLGIRVVVEVSIGICS